MTKYNLTSLLVELGYNFQLQKNDEKAKIYYNKALDAEPGFLYVKDELYPQLMKKMNQIKCFSKGLFLLFFGVFSFNSYAQKNTKPNGQKKQPNNNNPTKSS